MVSLNLLHTMRLCDMILPTERAEKQTEVSRLLAATIASEPQLEAGASLVRRKGSSSLLQPVFRGDRQVGRIFVLTSMWVRLGATQVTNACMKFPIARLSRCQGTWLETSVRMSTCTQTDTFSRRVTVTVSTLHHFKTPATSCSQPAARGLDQLVSPG